MPFKFNPFTGRLDATGSGTGLTEVTASDVNSGEATDGYVLTADGAGGAAWEEVGGSGLTHPQILARSLGA